MAAAAIKDFKRASEYFSSGVAKADAAGLVAIATGLLADNAFSEWQAGDFERSISLFADVLKRLDALPNSKDDIRSFRVRKVVGQMLIHVEHAALGVETRSAYPPPSGAASDPEA